MDTSSLLQKLYDSDPAYYDACVITPGDTMADEFLDIVISCLTDGDNLVDAFNSIYTADEINFMFNELNASS